jgi:hypothetical protein
MGDWGIEVGVLAHSVKSRVRRGVSAYSFLSLPNWATSTAAARGSTAALSTDAAQGDGDPQG